MRFMKKKIFQPLILIAAMMVAIAGCDSFDGTESPSSDTFGQLVSENDGSSDVNLDFTLNQGAYTTAYEYTRDDENGDWDDNAATVAFDGSTALILGSGASFSEGVLSITQAGTYVLSGALTDGQVFIDAKDEVVRLVLNGVSLHCEYGPAIYSPKCEKLVLILSDDTENTVSDGENYTVADDETADNANAAIFIQNDLSITGGGSLTVNANYKHGIRTQDILVITGGEINVTSVGDALRGRDGIAVRDGSITLTSEGDGIQSNNTDEARGYVIINGGLLNIQTQKDGIQAESVLTVTGGNLNITTGGGSVNAPAREEDFRVGWGGQGGFQMSADVSETEDTVSMKALKAGKQVIIAGGDIRIDAEDDALHSNDTVFITGGNLYIKTGDDGVHANAAVEISGGKIDIPVCYEGIEGISVTISGGDISVVASDDAINAAGGADNASPRGGPMGPDRFAADGDVFISISGGTLDLYAPHDGIDSNGNIFISGGIIKISGPSQGMEGAIDLDGTMLITGGELITAGSVANVSSESTQPTLLVSYTVQQTLGSTIAVRDARGNTLLEYTSATAYTMSGFTSPSFVIGETYALFINGEKKSDIKLDSVVTSTADDGGAYSSGMGGRGMGGNRGDRSDFGGGISGGNRGWN